MGKGNSTFALPPKVLASSLALCPRVNAVDSRPHGTCSLLVHESRCMPSVETHRIRPGNGPQMPVGTLVACLHKSPLCVPAHLCLESHFWAGCHGQDNACRVGEEKCQHTWSSLSRRNPLSRYARRRGGEAKPTRNKVGLNRGEGSVS